MTADDVEKTSLRRNTTSQYFLDRKRVKYSSSISSSVVTGLLQFNYLVYLCLLFNNKWLLMFL